MAPKILLRNVRNVKRVRNMGKWGLMACADGNISSHFIVLILKLDR